MTAHRILRLPRRAALVTIAVLIAVTALASFAQSYRGLYEWASEHGLRGAWAYAWPVQVDTFIAVGELALFVALVDGWPFRSRIAAWVVTGIGLLVSVAGNVGHVTGHSWWVRGTAAVPPVAAAAALAVGLGILKRIVEQSTIDPGTAPPLTDHGAVPAVPAPVSAGPPTKYKAPGQRKIMAEVGVGQDKARRFQRFLVSEIRAAANGNGSGPHE